jgi:hypothetical protein
MHEIFTIDFQCCRKLALLDFRETVVTGGGGRGKISCSSESENDGGARTGEKELSLGGSRRQTR